MRRYSVTVGGQKKEIGIEERTDAPAGAVRVLVDGQERLLELRQQGGLTSWLDGPRVVNAEVQPTPGQPAAVGEGRTLTVTVAGESLSVVVADAVVERAAQLGASARTTSGPLAMRAPMPGRVVKLLARAGEQVKAGQGILVVEAMKMENELRAPRDGLLREISVSEGAAVEAGEQLAMID